MAEHESTGSSNILLYTLIGITMFFAIIGAVLGIVSLFMNTGLVPITLTDKTLTADSTSGTVPFTAADYMSTVNFIRVTGKNVAAKQGTLNVSTWKQGGNKTLRVINNGITDNSSSQLLLAVTGYNTDKAPANTVYLKLGEYVDFRSDNNTSNAPIFVGVSYVDQWLGPSSQA